MARKLYYKILDDGKNRIADKEWEEISKLEHWYNSEFFWTAGKISMKMFAVFPNIGHYLYEEHELWQRIVERRSEMRAEQLSENDITRLLEAEGLVIVKKGGYFDNCIASGFTRVAANEWNAYLVCEFLLKTSLIVPNAILWIEDEGEFIKSKVISLQNGKVTLPAPDVKKLSYFESMVLNNHVFSVVDPSKYDHLPVYRTTISDFEKLNPEERSLLVRELDWLGFENNFDVHGDDVQGVDLNKKIASFGLKI